MPSPFPGMNPFLEQDEVWHDFHQAFLPVLRQSLVQQVSPKYIVKLELHIYIRELATDERRLLGRADLGIERISSGAIAAMQTATVDAPIQCFVPSGVDVLEESYIEVRETATRRLVTTIELLSPSNKRPGPDREAYISKRRQQLVSGNTNFVEIDLLRGGPRMPLEGLPDCDYYALVARAGERPKVDVWPVLLRDRLPTIAIPLLPEDAEVQLKLQELLHVTYVAGGYANYIYDAEPDPRLSPADRSWAEQIVNSERPILH